MRFLKAEKLFDGTGFVSGHKIVALNSRNEFAELLEESAVDPAKVETLSGILTPGFVNAHCHTELSHLKHKIPQHTGLPEFARQVIVQRNSVSKGELKEHIREADKEMYENGIVAVGDICNTDDSFRMKEESRILYHSFIELIGLNPTRAETVFTSGLDLFDKLKSLDLPGSLAPHAPYTTSKELIKRISGFNTEKKLPSSIHNQESPEEQTFFMGQKSGFQNLYDFLKLDIGWFVAPKTSSLNYYAEALGDQQTLLIHNTFTNEEDIRVVKDQNIFWCFCPNANMYIENTLPDLSFFPDKSRICFGTDSLASNTQLSLVSEVNLLLEKNVLDPEDALRGMTSAGAAALMLENKFGRFIPGKNTGLNLLEIKNNQFRLLKKLA